MSDAPHKWQTSQQMYGGWISEKVVARERVDRRLTTSMTSIASRQENELTRTDARRKGANAVGAGTEAADDRMDHFGSHQGLVPNDEVNTIPHFGGHHEDLSTIDHFGSHQGLVPIEELNIIPHYGGGHEELDTLDHFDAGTLVPSENASIKVNYNTLANKLGQSNLDLAMNPNANGSETRWEPKATTQTKTRSRAKGYRTKTTNILGGDTNNTRQDRLAFQHRAALLRQKNVKHQQKSQRTRLPPVQKSTNPTQPLTVRGQSATSKLFIPALVSPNKKVGKMKMVSSI
jgi:hypothetical protein